MAAIAGMGCSGLGRMYCAWPCASGSKIDVFQRPSFHLQRVKGGPSETAGLDLLRSNMGTYIRATGSELVQVGFLVIDDWFLMCSDIQSAWSIRISTTWWPHDEIHFLH